MIKRFMGRWDRKAGKVSINEKHHEDKLSWLMRRLMLTRFRCDKKYEA
jgi:hypothetical protein